MVLFRNCVLISLFTVLTCATFSVGLETVRFMRSMTAAADMVAHVASTLPAEVQATRQALVGEVAFSRGELSRQMIAARLLLDRHLSLIESSAVAAVAGGTRKLDLRLGEVTGSIDGFRGDFFPVIKAATLTTIDVKQAIDDLYPDLKATVESSAVTARSVAEAAGAIERQAPAQAKAITELSQQGAGIAADLHAFTEEVTRPKRWWQRALGPLYTVAKFVAPFLF